MKSKVKTVKHIRIGKKLGDYDLWTYPSEKQMNEDHKQVEEWLKQKAAKWEY